MHISRRKVMMKPDERYQFTSVLGEGAYGTVFDATDKICNQKVAIKRLRPFKNSLFAIRALREIRTLKFFRDKSENIVNMYEVFSKSTSRGLEFVYIAMERMETDLHKVIHSQELTVEHHRYFSAQLLQGLAFIHSSGIVHRDIKPSNLFINSDCRLKIGDFGLSRIIQHSYQVNRLKEKYQYDHKHETNFVLLPKEKDTETPSEIGAGEFTDYVATRWYRPPEILLQTSYDQSMDVWSCGCVIAEMIRRKALFKGKDTFNQLSRIIETIPIDEESLLEIKSLKTKTGKRIAAILENDSKKISKPLDAEIPGLQADCLDLLNRLLKFNKKCRILCDEVLNHKFVKDYLIESPNSPDIDQSKEIDGFKSDLDIEGKDTEKLLELIKSEDTLSY